MPTLFSSETGLTELKQCSSTQEEAQKILEAKNSDIAWAFSLNQTKGRGQRNRSWSTTKNHSLALSCALKKNCLNKNFPLQWLPLLSGFALYKSCQSLKELNSKEMSTLNLKWPNDLVFCYKKNNKIHLKKCAGILCEAKNSFILIGWGVNLFKPAPFEGAACLEDHFLLGDSFQAKNFSEKLIEEFYTLLNRMNPNPQELCPEIIEELLKGPMKELLNQEIPLSYEKDIKKQAFFRGLNEKGAALYEKDNQKRWFYSPQNLESI